MRPVRLLCVAVALSVCAVLAGGGGLASAATELCEDPNCVTVYPSGQEIAAELAFEANTTIVSSMGTVKCAISTTNGKTTAKSGEPLTGEVTGMTFETCFLNESSSCTVTAVNLPYSATLKGTEKGNGTLTVKSGGSGSPGAKFVCSGLTCTGTATEIPYTMFGGSPALVVATNAKFTVSGFFCPTTAEFSTEQKVKEPMPMQVKDTPTVLCIAAPDGSGVCPKGKQYAGGKVYGEQSSGVPTFETYQTGARIVTCKKASFEGDYDKAGHGKVEKMTFVGDGVGACTSNFQKTAITPENPSVTVTLSVLPFTNSFFRYRPLGGIQGDFSFGPTFKMDYPPKQPDTRLELYVAQKILCTYRWLGLKTDPKTKEDVPAFRVSNGAASQTTMAMLPVWRNRAETPTYGICPTDLQQATNLALTRPEVNGEKNIYIAKSVAP